MIYIHKAHLPKEHFEIFQFKVSSDFWPRGKNCTFLKDSIFVLLQKKHLWMNN